MRSTPEVPTAVPGGEAPLSLDLNKNNSHPPKKPTCHIGFFRGVFVEDGTMKAIRGNIPCKKWSCPDCAPSKVRALKKRLSAGGMTEFVDRKGFRTSKYAFKMLTLTCPGKEYRATHTPKEALEEMAVAWERLRKAMAKRWGKFHYLRVTEPHKDGFPHFHILIVGHAISGKEVLNQVRELWCDKYEMGNIDLQVLRKGFGAGINYVMKYLTKTLVPIAPKKRVFTASRGALEPMPCNERDYLEKRFELGKTNPDCTGFETFEFGSIENIPEKDLKQFAWSIRTSILMKGIV